MTTTLFDAVTAMYDILNVEAITDLLDGKLYRHERKEGSEGKRCIEINSLTHDSDFVTEGVLNVNIYAPTLSNNMNDDNTLTEILSNIVEAISAYSNSSKYWIFELDSQHLLTDEREESYVNVRINYFCEL